MRKRQCEVCSKTVPGGQNTVSHIVGNVVIEACASCSASLDKEAASQKPRGKFRSWLPEVHNGGNGETLRRKERRRERPVRLSDLW